MLTRHQVQRFPCPVCRAGQGKPCRRTTDDPEGEGPGSRFQGSATYILVDHS